MNMTWAGLTPDGRVAVVTARKGSPRRHHRLGRRGGVGDNKRQTIRRAAENHMAMMEQHEQDEIYRLSQELHLTERTVERVWEIFV